MSNKPKGGQWVERYNNEPVRRADVERVLRQQGWSWTSIGAHINARKPVVSLNDNRTLIEWVPEL